MPERYVLGASGDGRAQRRMVQGRRRSPSIPSRGGAGDRGQERPPCPASVAVRLGPVVRFGSVGRLRRAVAFDPALGALGAGAADRRQPSTPATSASASSSRWTIRCAASFSGSIVSARRARVSAPTSSDRSRATRARPDDRDRVARVGADRPAGRAPRRDRAARPTARPRPGAAARSRGVGDHRAGQEQQRRPVVEGRIGDDPLEQRRRGSVPGSGPAAGPSSAIRSVPSTARPRRSRTASAASSAAIRALSSPSRPALGRQARSPTLSASRSASSSPSAPSPSLPILAMNRRTAASDQLDS